MSDNITRRQALASVSAAASSSLFAGAASANPEEATPMRFVETSLSFTPTSDASGDWSYQRFAVDHLSNPGVDPVNNLVTIPSVARGQAQQKVSANGSLVYQGGRYSNRAVRFSVDGDAGLPGEGKILGATSLNEPVEADVLVTGNRTTVETPHDRVEIQTGERQKIDLDAVTAELVIERPTDRQATDSLPDWRTATVVDTSTETVTVQPELTVLDHGEMDVRIGQ